MKSFINISAIVDRVLQHPLMSELTFEQAIRGTVDCIRLIGVPTLFDYKYKEIPIEEYRGELPLDFLEMDPQCSVRRVHGDATKKTYTALVTSESSHTQFSSYIDPTRNRDTLSGGINEQKYVIKDRYIITPFEEGMIDLVYKGLYLDEDGYPFIPDNTKVVKAIEFYLQSNHFRILADMRKIDRDVAEKAEQEYTWYVGGAQSENLLSTLDQRQAISNILTNLFINNRDHSTFFENVGVPEKFRRNI